SMLRSHFSGKHTARSAVRTGSAPGHSNSTTRSGGVTSLTSTSSHRACVNAGRRTTRPAIAANTARTVAATALLTPVRKSSSTGRSVSAAGAAARILPVRVVDRVARLPALAAGEPPGANEVRQQGGERAAAQFFRHVFQSAADQLVAANGGFEFVGPAAAPP